MSDIFVTAFSETFIAVFRVFIIIIMAGLLVRRHVITHDHILGLTAATVNVFLPCLIFSNIVMTFDPSGFPIWWLLPLSAVLLTALGIILSGLAFWKELPAKKNMLAIASLQNAGCLILPIGAVIYADEFDMFALYTFLFVLAINPLLWSLGKHLCTDTLDQKKSWKGLINPPLVANVVGLTLVFTNTQTFFTNKDYSLTHATLQSIELLGTATVPLASFILGAALGSIKLDIKPYLFDAIRSISIKLLILPLIMIGLLYYTGWCDEYPILADFFVLEAAAPPATTLILQIKNYGGDEHKMSSLMMASYILCIITMPLSLALWHSIR